MAIRIVPLLTAALVTALLSRSPIAQSLVSIRDAADQAWQRGDYIAALNDYVQLLNDTGAGSDMLRHVALATGELFVTRELTDDGRAGRFSQDGRFIALETGLEVSRRTRVLRNDGSLALVADLRGVSATFSRDGRRVAYLRIDESDDVRRAEAAVDAASLTASDRGSRVQALSWLVMRDSTIVVRDLVNGREAEVRAPGVVKTGLVFGPDGWLFFLGAREGDESGSTVYRVRENGAAPEVVETVEGAKGPPSLDPSGRVLIVPLPALSPLRRPASVAARVVADAAGALAPPAPAAQGSRPNYALLDLMTGQTSTIRGTGLTFSTDGSTLAYVTREGAQSAIVAGPPNGPHQPVFSSDDRLDAPALSPKGRRVAWQRFVRENWEIFVADLDGAALRNERRLTREIQHDVLPRFLTEDRLLAMVGEGRHRRSYLYNLGSDGGLTPLSSDRGVRPPSDPKLKIFHNNTVRTIAPEYQWAASPDGLRIIIGAERDGDTISPRRGVYLVDTTQTVTKAELLARLRRSLEAETALKADGTRAFSRIADGVRQVVSQASVDRIYAYEKALFDFDSKHIALPGNRRASEYLFETYRSFGYEPQYQWLERSDAFEGRTANVVATLRGTVNPDLVYVISSHYDSVEVGPGADDNSSGTAALLEAARVLAGRPQPATIVFASMTAEEGGLYGSREFVRLAVENGTRIMGVLNNDMIGWANDQRLDNTVRYSNPGIRDVQHAAAMLFTSLITYDAQYWKNTDAMSFYDVYGDVIGGIGAHPVVGNPHYHQATDLLDTVNHQLVAETSKATTAAIMLLASSPSRLAGLKAERSENSVTLSWTPGSERDITSYVIAYGPADAPFQQKTTVSQATATLTDLPAGTVISVRAVNARGVEGWDWARVVVGR